MLSQKVLIKVLKLAPSIIKIIFGFSVSFFFSVFHFNVSMFLTWASYEPKK